jgi:hypothetical protein
VSRSPAYGGLERTGSERQNRAIAEPDDDPHHIKRNRILEVFVLLAGLLVLASGFFAGFSPFRVILGGVGVVLAVYFLFLFRPEDWRR